jgi:transcriptional regulator with XRE-family HTH domain
MDTKDEVNNGYLRLVGDKVRERRKSLGLTQEALAELAGCHLTYLSHLEGGKANASILVLRKIAAALHVSLVELLDVNLKSIEKDALMKSVVEIKRLPAKEQQMMVNAIKGLIEGLKGKE